jgi:hypothetical protein
MSIAISNEPCRSGAIPHHPNRTTFHFTDGTAERVLTPSG